jgi:transcription initiation factor TFIID subunit 2
VRVHYQLVQPRAGAYFVLPTETAYSRRVPHMYTHNQEDNGARAWMPTVDHVGERCSWEMEITVAQGQIAVASGELLEQVWVDDEETKKTFYYKQSVPVPARSVALAVGPFVVYPDPHVPSITHFCLPGRIKELQYTVDFLGKVQLIGA